MSLPNKEEILRQLISLSPRYAETFRQRARDRAEIQRLSELSLELDRDAHAEGDTDHSFSTDASDERGLGGLQAADVAKVAPTHTVAGPDTAFVPASWRISFRVDLEKIPIDRVASHAARYNYLSGGGELRSAKWQFELLQLAGIGYANAVEVDLQASGREADVTLSLHRTTEDAHDLSVILSWSKERQTTAIRGGRAPIAVFRVERLHPETTFQIEIADFRADDDDSLDDSSW